MTPNATVTELRNMTIDDLKIEIRTQKHAVSKLGIAVKLQKEKNSAKYRKAKKKLAQLYTVLVEKITQNVLISSDA